MNIFLTFFLVCVSKSLSKCVYQDQGLLAAILPLHSGPSCNHTNQRGAQQMSALFSARDAINSLNNKIHLDIKIFDSCSSPKQATTSTLKALLLAHTSCEKPFFLGILTPDDDESLRAISKIISAFPYPHFVAAVPPSLSLSSALKIDIILPTQRAEAIRSVLEEMNWSSFYFAFTDDRLSTEIAGALVDSSKTLCVLDSMIRIPVKRGLLQTPESTAYNKLLQAIQQDRAPKRILIIADTANSAENLLKYLSQVIIRNQMSVIVYVNQIGLLPWKLSDEIAKQVLVLQQQAMTSALVEDNIKPYLENTSYYKEFGVSADLPLDYSITSLTKLLYLIRQGLENGVAKHCPHASSICPLLTKGDTWKTVLEGTTTQVKTNEGYWKKLFFHSVEENSLVLHKFNENATFEEFGRVLDDNRLLLYGEVPKEILGYEEQCATDTVAVIPKNIPEILTTTGIPLDLSVNVFGFQIHLGKLGYYELIGSLTGIVIGMVLLILALICLIYRCFRVQTTKDSSTSSSSSNKSRNQRFKNKRKIHVKK